MKKLLAFILLLTVSTASWAQQKKAAEVISFTEMRHDFGKIKQGVPVNYNFIFKNISNQPVVIESAVASCGCTTPSWPKAPVMKDKTDKIVAGFNAAATGPFNKTITVKVAGIDLPLELNIVGEVLNAGDYVKYESGKEKKDTK